MIFAVETEERSLLIFPDEAKAISHCEGLDVEAAIWLFWDAAGRPLQPEFITPNKRCLFSAQNGTYRLVLAGPEHHADLLEALDHIKAVEGPSALVTVEDVRSHLTRDREAGSS